MSFRAFDRTVSFAPGSADAAWVERELAAFARASLREAIGEGAGSPVYVKAVNGRRGAAEESVRAPGPIVYSFDWLREASVFALAWFGRAAPVRSGRFRRSFIAIADGREVAAEAIGAAGAVTIVNTQPYARKIQVGAAGFESYRGLFDAARRAVDRQFRGLVKTRVRFVSLSGAYTLRRGAGRRADRRAGASLSYPALELMSETVVVN